jgi:hypothetical protein
MDPVAMKLAALYPNPNTALANCGGAAAGAGCYAVATPGALNTDQGDGRVDWHYNDNNSIYGTISWANTAKSSVPPFPGALDGGNFQGSSEQDLGRNAMLSWAHTFSPTMVNEARIGFSRLVTARTQANANTDVYKQLGIGLRSDHDTEWRRAADRPWSLQPDWREQLAPDQGVQQRMGHD